MSAFHYTAVNNRGEQQKGIIEADSAKQARQMLREKQLTPLEVQLAQQKTTALTAKSFRRQSLSSKELALITRQLATLLQAGLPLEEVLAAVSEQTEKQNSKSLLLSVRGKVLEGHSFAAALGNYPHAFSNLYCSTIAAGERSGHLDVVLQRLADYTEQQFQMKQKIQNALIYPTIMVLVAISIVGFLLEYVVPKMIAVYSNIGQTLPTLTRILIAISAGVKSYGLIILLLILLLVFLLRYRIRNNTGFRGAFHRTLLRLPIMGNAIKTVNTARFSRTFAILSSAGVSVIEAMMIASALITNLPIRNSVESAAKKVKEGANIHLALKQTAYFPAMSIHLIASGEASGQLENMLERAANNQEGDITRLIDTTLALFEPAIILVMGAIVLFIVLAVLLPIFQLDQFTG